MSEPVPPSARRPAAGRVPVVPSASHTVLCEVPAAGATAAPPAADLWDERHVRLPCSPQSLYPVRQPDGQMKLVQRWSMVQDALLAEMKTSADLEKAIKSYNSRYKDKWDFSGLRYFIDEILGDEEREHLFAVTLPQLCRLALRLPELLRAPLPLLVRRCTRSVSLSQLQVAALLANAFFCTFPRRNAAKRGDKPAEYSTYPDINFNRLFGWGGGRRSAGLSQRRVEKLKCLLHYFHRVLKREPTGVITFTRQYLEPAALPDWESAAAPLRAARCESDGLIEDQQGLLQVDFANKFVGGGVLGDGCVQEEIRFLINPELIVSRLFTEVLDVTECLVITGCERFSQFEGYSDTFKWTAKANDPSPMDEYVRRSTQIVALDAIHFIHASKQYEKHFLLRELNKAYVGFFSEDAGALPAVATGNWGCGAFNGDPRFKSLLQMMAAALARRDLVYLTFGDEKLSDELRSAHTFLRERDVTVGQLYRALLAYGRLHGGRSGRPDVFHFLYGHLGGDDYGSDTDLEQESAGLNCEDWSQEMTEDTPDVASTSKSRERDAMSDMEESQPLADGDDTDRLSPPASPASPDGAGSACDSASQADLLLEAAFGDSAGCDLAVRLRDAAPDERVCAGAKRVRRADSDAGADAAALSAAEQFARFEVVSETERERAASRQTKITSFLKK